jgi:fibronectin-binding autotransporter adhesin
MTLPRHGLRLFLAATVTAVLLPSSAFAESATWTNPAANGLWSDDGNWDTGSPPGSSDYAFISNGGTANVTDTRTVGVVLLGYDPASSGSLTVNGGNLTISFGTLGNGAGSSGSVLVTGSSSQLTINNAFSTGFGNNTGVFRIEAGATVIDHGNTQLGSGTSNVTATLTGADSSWQQNYRLSISSNSGGSSLTVDNGAAFEGQSVFVGSSFDTQAGHLTVTGAGTTFSSTSFSVYDGVVSFEDGATITSSDNWIEATATVTGAGTHWTVPSFALQPTGILNIADGGTMTSTATTQDFEGGTANLTGSLVAGRGALEVNRARLLSGSALKFDGGILRATADSATFLTTGFGGGTVQFLAGGGFFDSNGHTIATALPLTGIGGLTKLGGGTLALTGTNTYTGPTTVSAGILRFGKTAALYNGNTASWTADNLIVQSGATAAFNVGGSGEFTATDLDLLAALGTATGGFLPGSAIGIDTTNAGGNFTYGSVLADPNSGANALGLVKLGTGTLTLTAANTYTGGTTVSAGTLAISASERLADSGALTVNGGTFDIAGFDETVGAVALASGTISGTTGVLTGSSYDAQSGTISAILNGSAGLTKTTSGTVTLSGANTYSGGTTVSAGTLAISASERLADSGALTVNGGTFDIAGFDETVAAITLASGTISGATGVLTGSSYDAQSGTVSAILAGTAALAKTTSGTVTLSGANAYTGGTTLSAGTLALGSAGALGSTGTISLGGGALQFSASNTTDYSPRFSTAADQQYNFDTNGQSVTLATALTSTGGSLTKSGTGTLTLTGASTYTGGTTVRSGSLVVDGGSIFHPASDFLVGNLTGDNATLEISGTGAVSSGQGYVGFNSGSTGMVTVSGGSWTDSTAINVGLDGNGTLEITGGQVSTDSVGVGVNGGSTGAVSLSGGTLTTGQVSKGTGTGTVAFTGGTLQLSANQAGLFSGFAGGNVTLGTGGPRPPRHRRLDEVRLGHAHPLRREHLHRCHHRGRRHPPARRDEQHRSQRPFRNHRGARRHAPPHRLRLQRNL